MCNFTVLNLLMNFNMKTIKLVVLIWIIILTTNCNNNKWKDDQDKLANAVLVYEDIKDDNWLKFDPMISGLDECKQWVIKNKNISYLNFNSRKLKINEQVFYHLELRKTFYYKPYESTIKVPYIVCYFRVDSNNNVIKIYNNETKEFINLMSSDGRKYLKKCLN